MVSLRPENGISGWRSRPRLPSELRLVVTGLQRELMPFGLEAESPLMEALESAAKAAIVSQDVDGDASGSAGDCTPSARS